MKDIFLHVKTLKNNNTEFEEIYRNFENFIDMLTRKYDVEKDYNDIVSHLWIILKKTDLNKFNTEYDLEKYISTSLKRYCIDICNKKNRNERVIYNSEFVDINLSLIEHSFSNDLEFEFNDLISILPNSQRKIIYMRFFNNMKEVDIAEELNISRQAVYKSKNLALKKLESVIKELINI
ncbi:transcriptional regulator BotR, P-21 [Clostridium argentinense CDC 2741]|uniref:Transcriptional regulator BotR, P-21 n=3 Tax=Clostridium TaxID=1485 RepID=A0A0C1QVR0_9CLOT|nr:botulinum neurotoxin transcription-activating sigma factor BotR [Clostridium argentinense]ARC83159.1 transcriptional regulator BotR, P-21 [Clostridium argentinense]KIE45057.1 transcriptional regulator BotR, P-21 [Clostridium argentinense CDC 2741]NFF41599.1 botulinum neurotoxin transcription-activating sigma factor BotR [Clostridium argentinense]NFP52299.1 botulinum neurotoxin transcription-activating sigma factor BotR [Clostridium argentinense]NFP74688.1 botulinum neurotoxin transcription-